MIGLIAALALAPSFPHFPNPFAPVASFGPGPFGADADEGRTVAGLPGGWRLSRRDDRFTGTTSCRLERRDVRLASGVVTFSFGRRIDTANALYRLDGGPVRTAGEVGPEVAGHGVSYLSRNTWNPSDGRVRVPWTTVAGARRIDIRANPRREARSFELDSLDAAVATARQGGCGDLV